MNSLHRSSSCSLFKHVLSFVVILFSDEDVTKDSKKSKEKKKKEQLPVVTYSQLVSVLLQVDIMLNGLLIIYFHAESVSDYRLPGQSTAWTIDCLDD